jgi:hypothetical protein
MAQPRARAQRERDRELTSKYYLEGMNQYAIAKKLEGKNQQNNIDRYYRVAFEKLQEYKTIENRRDTPKGCNVA